MRRIIIIVVVLSWLTDGRAQAGPWIPRAWHFLVYLRQSVELAGDRYDVEGQRSPGSAITDQGTLVRSFMGESTTAIGGEVGVASRLALTLDFLAFRAAWQRMGEAGNRSSLGVSDLALGAKLLLFDDEVTATLQVNVTFPTGSATSSVPLGPGDTRADFLVLVGKVFERVPLFASAEAGVSLRSAAQVTDPLVPGTTKTIEYSSQIIYGATVGYTFVTKGRRPDRITFMARAEGRYSLGRATDDGVDSFTPVSPTLLKLGPTIAWMPIPSLEIDLGGAYFVLGRTVPAFGEAVLGIVFRR
jgi:hypothetical protein